jgi:hypothetical protein
MDAVGPRALVRVAASALALAAAVTQAGQKPLEPAFVPGEVIVAFRKGSDPEALVAAAAKGDEAARPRLDAFVAGLSEKIGLPLRVRRVASGGDVILEVELGPLRSRLRAQLQKDRRAPETSDEGALVRAQFAEGGRDADAIEKARADKGENAPAPPSIIDDIAREVGFPLTGRLAGRRALLLAVDLAALTTRAVERLRRQPDVAYAQPNYTVRTLGVSEASPPPAPKEKWRRSTSTFA